jgi:hypothetical protein
MTTTRNPKHYYVGIKMVILTNSRVTLMVLLNTGTQDILIGDGYAGNYAGNIGFCFVWDRELSATEIKTYYDRTKLRFGLS